MALTARRLVFAAPRTVRIEPVELARPGPGEVMIRTEFSGISAGTELLAYRGEIDPSTPLDETLGALQGTFTFPFAYGYSCVGTVEHDAGSPTDGERVFAFHPHQDMLVVPERDVVPVGAVDARTASLFPLVETALQVALDADAGIGASVVVIGLGAVGILSAALLDRSGAEVLGSDSDGARRDAAAAFGIAVTTPEDLRPEVEARTRGRGADIAVEATGNPAALSQALALLAHEGTALVCSWYGTKPVPLALGAEFHRRRLAIRSTQVSTIPTGLRGAWTIDRRRAEVRRLLDELPVKALATHEFGFDEAPDAYRALDRGEPGLIHAALRYP